MQRYGRLAPWAAILYLLAAAMIARVAVQAPAITPAWVVPMLWVGVGVNVALGIGGLAYAVRRWRPPRD